MNRYINRIAVIPALLLAFSCQNEALEPDTVGNDGTVTVTVEIADAVRTKAVADGSSVTTVYYEVYDETGNTRVFPAADPDRTFPAAVQDAKDENALAVTDGKATLAFKVLKNTRYHLVFWAMGDEAPYTWSDFSAIDMNYDVTDADREAFYGSTDVEAGQSAVTVTLTRPFALLNIGAAKEEIVMHDNGSGNGSEPHIKTSVASAEKYFRYDHAEVTVSGVAEQFNAIDGSATGSTVQSKDQTGLVLNPGTSEGEGYLATSAKEYIYMYYQYVLPSDDVEGVVDVEAHFHSDAGKYDYSVTNVPVKVNYRTNILGRVFTGTGSLEVELDKWESSELEYTAVTSAEALQAAIDAIPVGGSAEINLGGDIVFDNDGNQVQTRASSVPAAIMVPAGKTVTINFGGNAMSWSTDLVGTSLILNKGNLTLKGEGSVSYAYTGEPDTSYGTGNYTISNTGTLTIDGPVVENLSGPISHASYAVDNNSINSPASFTLESGKVENLGNHAMRQIGGNKPNKVTVNGGEIVGRTRAVWMHLSGSNAADAPVMTFDLNGGKLEGKEPDKSDNQLALYSYSYGNDMKNVTINITDGTVIGDVALTGGLNKTNIETLNITGGTFTGLWGCAYSYGDDTKAQKAISITGGTFNYDVSFYVDEGWKTVEKEKGVWTVEPADPVASVAGKNCFSLKSAIAAVPEGQKTEVKLLTDVVLDASLTVPANKNVVLDLDGKTISQTATCTESYGMIVNKGTLAVTGNGKLSFTDEGKGDSAFGWGSYTLINNGTLVVENGRIENMTQLNQTSVVHMYCAIHQGYGAKTTTINGGTISTPTYRSIRVNNGALIINGGIMEGQVWMHPFADGTSIEINGGEFAPCGVDGSSVFVTNNQYNVKVDVTGGKFNTKIGCSDAAKCAGAITGGEFSEAAKNGTNSTLLGDRCIYEASSESGWYTIVQSPAATVENVEFMSLDAAIAAVPEGQKTEIALLNDVRLSERLIIPAGKDVVIDLGGKTLTVNDETSSYALSNLGTLTLKNGTVNARGIYNGYSENGNVTDAKLIIESGTYNAKGTNGGAAVFNYAVLEIKGGTFTSVKSYGLNNQSSGKMTVSNADVTGGIYNLGSLSINNSSVHQHLSGYHCFYHRGSELLVDSGTFSTVSSNELLNASSSNPVVINGGTFTQMGKSYLFGAANAGIIINDGTFNGYVNTDGSNDKMRSGAAKVNGGTFNFDPNSWLADGFVSVDNEDGTWTVKAE